MTGNQDLKAFESFLRQQKLDMPVNQAHKARLREELFACSVKQSPFRMPLLFAGSAAAVLIIAFVFYPQMSNHIACTAVNGSGIKDILTGECYMTEENTITLNLDDESQLVFLPHSSFKVLSKTTDRAKEDAIVFLERGSLDADVAPNRDHHLFVRTPDVEIKVVGTKFSVTVTETTTVQSGGEITGQLNE